MSKYSEVKSAMLGTDFQLATLRLRKSLLFSLVQKLGLDSCYRCGQKIVTMRELSIDHKIAWMHKKNAADLFFDLDNIAFSHLSCNCKSRTQNVTRIGKSGYKGVIHCSRRRGPDVWQAMIHKNGKQIYVGTYGSAAEAAAAYDEQALLTYGDRAITNRSLGLI